MSPFFKLSSYIRKNGILFIFLSNADTISDAKLPLSNFQHQSAEQNLVSDKDLCAGTAAHLLCTPVSDVHLSVQTGKLFSFSLSSEHLFMIHEVPAPGLWQRQMPTACSSKCHNLTSCRHSITIPTGRFQSRVPQSLMSPDKALLKRLHVISCPPPQGALQW